MVLVGFGVLIGRTVSKLFAFVQGATDSMRSRVSGGFHSTAISPSVFFVLLFLIDRILILCMYNIR